LANGKLPGPTLRRASVALVAALASCGDAPPSGTPSLPAPTLTPSALTVSGVAPLLSSGLVLTDSMVVCVGDDAFKQVVCAQDGDWARAIRIGREGGGPGEFRGVFQLEAGAEGSVMVSDLPNNRLTWLSPSQGRVMRSLRAPPLFRVAGAERDGIVVGSELIGVRNYLEVPLSLRLTAISTRTGEVAWSRDYIVPERERDRDMRFLYYGWQLPDGTVGAMISLTGIGHWAPTGEYLGTVVSPAYRPRRWTEAEALELWAGLRRGAQRLGGPLPDSAQRVRAYMEELVPPYRGEPRLGPEGTVWFLTRGDGSTPGAEFEVFRGMEYLGRASIPEVVHAFHIRGSTMVVLTDLGSQAEFGFPERGVKLFDIRLP